MENGPLPPVPPEYDVESPPWNRTTKTVVVLVSLLLFALLAWRFSGLIAQVVMAAVLAYLLHPLIRFIDERTPLRRGTITLIVYILFLFLLAGIITALGLVVYNQVVAFINNLPNLVTQTINLLRDWFPDPETEILFGPFSFTLSTVEWSTVRAQALGLVEPLLSRSGQYVSQAAGTTLRLLGNVLFVWVVSIYTALEIPRLRGYVGSFAQPPGYRRDAELLMSEFGNIWSAYLRGQIILGLVIGTIVAITLGILQVQNALALGLLSGLLEFIPVVGPVIGTIAAMLVTLFQPTHFAGMSAFGHAGVVLAAMIVIQQLENNLLVPRIVGGALDLHPILVMVGVFMGASVAGILGAVLAAPVLASVKLVGVYAWRKMFDLPPFPPGWFEDSAADPVRRGVRVVLARLGGPLRAVGGRLTGRSGESATSEARPDDAAGR
ncbi:MAG: AI-2E family transporter [Anaerolineae bacterium]|nr:AI-2E family transporter [Anaerolineae bacterium]